jgi:hypothetical protein
MLCLHERVLPSTTQTQIIRAYCVQEHSKCTRCVYTVYTAQVKFTQYVMLQTFIFSPYEELNTFDK